MSARSTARPGAPRRRCPRCGALAVVPIVYGMPLPELFEMAERGEVLLGGCTIWPDQPERGCVECGWPDDAPLAVSASTAERLCCDAYGERVVHDADGEVVAISHRASVVRGKLRRLIQARDRICRVPGCGRRGRAEIHHMVHRGRGGTNAVDNLMLTCRYHHHLLHEGGWTAVHTDDGIEFHLPDARVIFPAVQSVEGSRDDVAVHGRSAADGRCRWIGDRLDLDMALTYLFAAQPWIDPWRSTASGHFQRTLGDYPTW
jgi:hypothetical protein